MQHRRAWEGILGTPMVPGFVGKQHSCPPNPENAACICSDVSSAQACIQSAS